MLQHFGSELHGGMLLTTSADHYPIIEPGGEMCQAGGMEGMEGVGRAEAEKAGWIRPLELIQPCLEKMLKEPPVSELSIPGH